MLNYKDLKHSDNGMPTWDGFLGPTLQTASTKDIWQLRDLEQAVIKAVNLPENLANLHYASKYHDSVSMNRINFAISDLKISGLLNCPKRGYYEISDLGKKTLSELGVNITAKYVHSLPMYVEYQKKRKQNASDEKADNDIQSLELTEGQIDNWFEKQKDNLSDELLTVEYQKKRKQNASDEKADNDIQSLELTEGQIDNWFEKQKDNLSDELLTKLRKTDPYVFEHMMIELMTRMGYKGADSEAFVTQKSNDGGIDGILNQDALGLRKIYVQVKRYAEDNTVGRQTISQFHGDLDLQGAGSGVFITTSSFTRSAEEAGKKFNIRLIDGEALTKLMIEYKVGVQVQDTFELLEIDNDFFERKDR